MLSQIKYKFWLDVVVFLGHLVSKERIKFNPQKIKAITKWPTLTNVTEVMSFLGLVEHYKRFVQDFSKIASPLNSLLKKNN